MPEWIGLEDENHSRAYRAMWGYLSDTIQFHNQQDVAHLLQTYPHTEVTRAELIQKFWLKTYEELLCRVVWQSKIPMTKEDFGEFRFIWRNFHCYFLPNQSIVAMSYKGQKFYHRFAQEHPELNNTLQELEKKKTPVDQSHLQLLYEAYIIMIGYDEVGSNYALLH